MIYRIAQPSDYQNIAKLHTTSWQENYQGMMAIDYLENRLLQDKQKIWKQRLTSHSPTQHILLAEQDNKLCGFICVIANNDEIYGSIIDNLHVDKNYKEQGIGTTLIKNSALWLEQKYSTLGVYLEVLAGNTSAIAFYQSLGAEKQTEATWLAPCGSHIKEHIYGWKSPKNLL
ncbi:GNAT family N-acetyltransferase [Colwelliaceae bacterium 6471]